MHSPHLETSLERLLNAVSPPTAEILDQALSGHDISIDAATQLFEADGADLLAIIAAADQLRAQTVGDVVTYVINRNINFTNVCVKQCGFCAFSRGHLAEEGYFLPIDEVVRRAREARDLGASEICVQAGLAPGMDGWYYVKLCRAVKDALPELHIHGFSPEEVLYGASLTGATIREYLGALRDAGVGSLPGTSAEIFVDEVRQRISPGRISIEHWIEVIQTAHEIGIPTTSTIMYGHIETPRHRAVHLGILRDVQRRTGGITEFVPLSFVYDEAPMTHRNRLPELRHGASGAEVMKMYAVSRLMLNNWIPNLQVSWVKEGPKLSQIALLAGANDFGGTLINESISTAAGASYGQLMKPSQFRGMIREMGRIPAERSTTYEKVRVFETDDNHRDLLDDVNDPTQRFGSYQNLIQLKHYRFREFYNQQKSRKA